MVAVPLIALAFVAGLAPGLNINGGNTDRGSGGYEGTTQLAYWVLYDTAADTIHTPLPGAASTTVGAPTVLSAAGQSYLINAGATTDNAVRWNFTEGTGAPVNTEVEITFSVADGNSGTTVTIKVYMETQGTAPASPVVFQFFYDLGGGGGPGSSAVQAFVQVSQQCAGIGTCP